MKIKNLPLIFSLLLLIGLFVGETIFAQSISVSVSATPASASAPLYGVDLAASVSGSAPGDITYRFDCTSDGTWERAIATAQTSYTAQDLCSYANPGTYTAKVQVEQGGLAYQGRAAIEVSGALQMTKLARNVSQNQNVFGEPLNAKPEERVEFQIRLASSSSLSQITLKDILPPQVNYGGNLKLDGVPLAGNLLTGVPLGVMSANQTKTVTFDAQIAAPNAFSPGETTLINTVIANSNEAAGSDALTIKVQKGEVLGAATSVSTGSFNLFSGAFLLALIAGFFLSYLLLLRFYLKASVFQKALQAKADRNLAKVVERIRQRERQRYS